MTIFRAIFMSLKKLIKIKSFLFIHPKNLNSRYSKRVYYSEGFSK